MTEEPKDSEIQPVADSGRIEVDCRLPRGKRRAGNLVLGFLFSSIAYILWYDLKAGVELIKAAMPFGFSFATGMYLGDAYFDHKLKKDE